MANAKISSESETFPLPAGQELRIELDHATQVAVTVRAGEAEVFGTPLVVGGRTVLWGPQKVAVYTSSGASVEVQVRAERAVSLGAASVCRRASCTPRSLFPLPFPAPRCFSPVLSPAPVQESAALTLCSARVSSVSTAGIARGHVRWGRDADGAVHQYP